MTHITNSEGGNWKKILISDNEFGTTLDFQIIGKSGQVWVEFLVWIKYSSSCSHQSLHPLSVKRQHLDYPNSNDHSTITKKISQHLCSRERKIFGHFRSTHFSSQEPKTSKCVTRAPCFICFNFEALGKGNSSQLLQWSCPREMDKAAGQRQKHHKEPNGCFLGKKGRLIKGENLLVIKCPGATIVTLKQWVSVWL